MIMRRRLLLAMAVGVLAAGVDVLAANERQVAYFVMLDEVTVPHEFTWALTTSSGKVAHRTLTAHLATNGTLTARLTGFPDATAKLPPHYRSGKPSLRGWSRGDRPKEIPLQAFADLLAFTQPLQAWGWRSHWEDGFESAFGETWVRFTAEPCTVGGRSGRRAASLPEKGPGAIAFSACISPDAPLPLSLELRVPRGRASYSLQSWKGPPAKVCPTCWHCGNDCGPAPRRPPAIGAAAPAWTASRWLPAAPPAATRGKVVLVQACDSLDQLAAGCRDTVGWLDGFAARHPEVLAITLLPPGTSDAAIERLGAKHALGVQTKAERDALDAAFDLKRMPAAWIVVDGKVQWYGIYWYGHRQWIAGNKFARDAKTYGVMDAAVTAAVAAVKKTKEK